MVDIAIIAAKRMYVMGVLFELFDEHAEQHPR
jgi:hypothetical protein